MKKVQGSLIGGGRPAGMGVRPRGHRGAGSFAALLVAAALSALSGGASAADLTLPAVNLGDTNFQDAIAFPGWLVEELVTYYHANQFRDYEGRDRAGSNQLTAVSAVTHVAWISTFKILDGWYGAEILVPVGQLDFKTEFGPKDRDDGLGDISVSPFFLQWPQYSLFGMPFFQRLDLLFKLPTGDYSRHSAVNTGSNVYSFNPYYAFTLVPASRLELSSRIYYLWNSDNDAPFYRLRANNSQPGQAVHANVAVSYEVLKDLRLGVAGYALQQLTDDKVDGDDQSRSRERVFGMGPGLKYRLDTWMLYLNSYKEFGAENRPEGYKLALRISKLF